MKVKGTELVEKRNVLNEIRHNDMTLQELRFFSIYLAKINARDISTRRVKFKLEEFQRIMDLGRMNIQHFKKVTDSLLGKVVHIPRDDGKPGYIAFQIFKECEVYQEENKEKQWYVVIDAHDRALPLMFNFKKNYFTYELWNALRLKSRNQLHMYELLKQYESIGIREIKLDQLKDCLGIGADEYSRWDNFKVCVLNECQKALKKYTDIQFEYEPMKTCRKITGVRFIISENKNYEDPLRLSEFIDKLGTDEEQVESLEVEVEEEKEAIEIIDQQKDIKPPIYKDEWINDLAEACDFEFSEEEMIVIKDLLFELGYCRKDNIVETYEYLRDKYHELNAKKQIPKEATNRRFGYMKWLLRNDLAIDKPHRRWWKFWNNNK